MVVDSVARAAMGNTGRHSRTKVSKKGSYASSSSHRSGAPSTHGSHGSEGAGRTRVRQNNHIHDKGKRRHEHLPSKRTPSASCSNLQKLGTVKSEYSGSKSKPSEKRMGDGQLNNSKPVSLKEEQVSMYWMKLRGLCVMHYVC